MRRPRIASRKPPTTRQRKTENPKRSTTSSAARRTTSSSPIYKNGLSARREKLSTRVKSPRGDLGGAARHQFVARRLAAGVRRHAGECRSNLVRPSSAISGSTMANSFASVRRPTAPRPPMSNIFAARVRSVPMRGSESAGSRKQGKRIKLPMWLPNRHMMTSCGWRRSIWRAPEPSWVCRCSRMAK